MSKCIFCGETKIYYTTDGMRCDRCGKLRRVCRRCEEDLEYKDGTYVCKGCGSKEVFLRRDENEEFNKNPIFHTEHLIEYALRDYDKKFRALLLMLVQKNVIKSVNDLEEILQSIDLLDTLKDDSQR